MISLVMTVFSGNKFSFKSTLVEVALFVEMAIFITGIWMPGSISGNEDNDTRISIHW